MTQWIARRRTLFFAIIAVVLVAAIAVGCTFTGSNKDQEPIEPDTSSSSDTSEDKEDDKQEEKSLLEGVLGTPLTDQALAYFQTLFAHVNAEKEEDINWYNIILSCGWNFTDDRKGFTVPQDVNLGTLFNNGFRDASSVSNWTAEELAFIQGFYPGYPENWGDLYRLPAEKMNKVLQDYFGITLEQSNKVRLDKMMYFADTNCYFGGPAGAVGEMNVQMLEGKVAANGTVYLICAADTTKVLNKMLLLALNPAPEGAARPYWVQMCTEVKEAQDVTAVMEQTLYLPPDIPAGRHERNSKYFDLRYRADSEIHDNGYDGKPYSLEGLEENCLYAIDDGVIYSISGAPIEEWARDYPNGYIYFVLQEDARKIWRTDLHGQNRTLIYESRYGEITFLKYDGKPGWLGLIENGNRCCYYNMDTSVLTVLLMPYSMEQFHYYADEQRLFWKGQLNESDTQVDLGGNTYNYYLKTGAYKMLKYNEKGTPQWVTVTPEK